jgi:hypothetical protein
MNVLTRTARGFWECVGGVGKVVFGDARGVRQRASVV